MTNPRSQELFAQASKLIPWGTQTNAKRPIEQFLPEMPAYIARARGCRMWDVDGNEYLDFRAALGPIILGYCDPDIDNAVKQQLDRGVLFSMAAPEEFALAQAICADVAGVEMVRFLKTGADACSASVKLARSITKRDRIISIGYHGWHDWCAAGVDWRSHGVPRTLAPLVHHLDFLDSESAQRLMTQQGDQIAAVVVTPYDLESDPEQTRSYLQSLRQLCTASNTLLIFDEVITGFRLALGGAAQYFGVEPDLVVYGKAIANGYPLAVLAGKQQFMQPMTDIFVTLTHGGELMSIAAAQATLKKLKQSQVHQHVWRIGQLLTHGISETFAHLNLPVELKGLAPCPQVILPETIQTHTGARPFRTNFIKAAYHHGLFWQDNLFIMLSHTDADIDQTIDIIAQAARHARDAEAS